jgi:hypothetical protein
MDGTNNYRHSDSGCGDIFAREALLSGDIDVIKICRHIELIFV